MPGTITKTADYCPACGSEVASAQELPADDDLVGQGVYQREGGHVIVGSGTVEIYEHADGEGDA